MLLRIQQGQKHLLQHMTWINFRHRNQSHYPLPITPRCLLGCLQVNTGAVWVRLCLCFKQPGLLWLHSKQVRPCLHMSSFGLIQQQMEGTGDNFLWSQVEYKQICTSHTTLTNVPKKVKRHTSLTKYFFETLFYTFSCWLHLFWTASYRTVAWSQDTQHMAYREGSYFAGSQNEKRPLCHRRHDVLNFLEIWVFLRWGRHVIGAVMWGPN